MRLACLALLALCACARPAGPDLDEDEANATACGSERWVVKTASDFGSSRIALQPVAGSIGVLSALPPPSTLPETARVEPTEVTLYQLTDVDLLQYNDESDSDYHLVVGDGTHTLIAEIPDPACVNAASPLVEQIKAARAAFEAKHGPVPSGATVSGERITLRGVGFFDQKHNQTGVAGNAIELHPVTFICFGQGCEPAPPPPPDPGPVPQSHQQGCSSAAEAPWLALLLLARRRRPATA